LWAKIIVNICQNYDSFDYLMDYDALPPQLLPLFLCHFFEKRKVDRFLAFIGNEVVSFHIAASGSSGAEVGFRLCIV